MDIRLKPEYSTGAKTNDGRGPGGLRARTQNGCVVCGQDNPYGLRIQYVLGHDGIISAEWRPTENWEGFEGIVHGGIISTVLDEATSKAVAAMNYEAHLGGVPPPCIPRAMPCCPDRLARASDLFRRYRQRLKMANDLGLLRLEEVLREIIQDLRVCSRTRSGMFRLIRIS